MASFASALSAKIADKGISIAQAAEAMDVSAPGLRKALAGASVPNARSASKYAKFLDVSADELKALISADKPAKGGKRGRKAKAKGGKPGRKPGRKAGKATGAKRGPKPGKRGRKAAGGSAASALAAISDALKSADALASDSLAVAVHNLSKSARAMVATVVDALG